MHSLSKIDCILPVSDFTARVLRNVWQALEEKSSNLHEQRMSQLALEREASRLRLEIERLRELQPLLHGDCFSMCRQKFASNALYSMPWQTSSMTQ